MEVNKELNKQIFIEVFVAFVFLGLILVGGYAIYNSVKGRQVLNDKDLILDVNDKDAPGNLYIMGDSSGLKTKPYIINVTNNSKKKVNYEIIFKHGISSNLPVENYLRIAIDDVIIKSLKDFKINKNGDYIIINEELEKGYTDSHTVKVWFSSESPNILSGMAAHFNFMISAE